MPNLFFYINRYLNIILVSSSNIIQQFLTIIITFILIKTFDTNLYGEYVVILSFVNLIVLFTNPSLTPFFIREGSKEYKKEKILNSTISLVFFFNSIVILFLIYFLSQINSNFELIKAQYLTVVKLLIISNVLINTYKIISRIIGFYYFYFFINLIEKILLLFSVLSFFYIFEIHSFTKIFFNYSIALTFILIISSFFILKYIKLTLDIKKIFKVFFKSTSSIYISTIIFFFVNQNYLIIFLKKNGMGNDIIASVGIGFLIVNMIYFPVYWLEQSLSQFYYKKINKFSYENFKEFYYNFGSISFYLIIFLVTILFFSIFNFEILSLIDEKFYFYREIICLIILISFSICLDTVLSIPIYAIKKENYMLIALFLRLLIFSFFLYFYDLSYIELILLFILCNYFQNLMLIFMVYKKYKFFDLKTVILISIFLLLIILFFLKFYLIVNFLVILFFFFSSYKILLYRNKILELLINR